MESTEDLRFSQKWLLHFKKLSLFPYETTFETTYLYEST